MGAAPKALAQAVCLAKLRYAMPISIASMIGLMIANIGITRKPNAIAAISKVRSSPGSMRKPLAAHTLKLDLV